MDIIYRPANRMDQSEMRFIGAADSRIPLEFDPAHEWNEGSVTGRVEYYSQLTAEDFFEVAEASGKIIAFHIVRKTPYPPHYQIGNIASLWVDPEHRGLGHAKELKTRAEAWAKKLGLLFMQTSVHKNNHRMLKMNESQGFESAYIVMRKRL